MHCSTLFSALVAGIRLVAAASIQEWQYAKNYYNVPPGGGITTLNYALTLEYLERKFYMEGLANYSHTGFVNARFPGLFYANLMEIYFDEVRFAQGSFESFKEKMVRY